MLAGKATDSIRSSDLLRCVGKTVTTLGCYVTFKHVRTIKGDNMAFGKFLDADSNFFDTTHFPDSFKAMGIYCITCKVVQEFDFPSIEVDSMQRLAIVGAPPI